MSLQESLFDIVVVGAGPAGLMAAIAAAQHGCRVAVCDRLNNPGRKLLASGGGRCNITMAVSSSECARSFGRKKSPFIKAVPKQFGPPDVVEFFESIGLKLIAEDGTNYYPATNRAADVLGALTQTAAQRGVHIVPKVDASEIIVSRGAVCGVRHAHGVLRASAGILAGGGCGYLSLGGSNAGCDLAAALGYDIVPPVPGLVALVSQEAWPGTCAGLSLEWSRLRIANGHDLGDHVQTEGELLFTHRGISGPAAIDLSATVNRILLKEESVTIRVVVQRETDTAVWSRRFEQWQQSRGSTRLFTCLHEYLPVRLTEALMTACSCPLDIRCADVSRLAKNTLSEALAQGMKLRIHASEGWDRAMVMSGGVGTAQIDASTMSGKLHQGLFFAGEVVDCDGPCGGYNLTWAFGSGWVSGTSAAHYVKTVRGRDH